VTDAVLVGHHSAVGDKKFTQPTALGIGYCSSYLHPKQMFT